MNQDRQKDKSLKFSFFDGIFASAMNGFIQDYFTPFLLLLGASAKQVGMLNAFPNLFASLVQLKSADFTEKLKSRRRIINLFVLIHALMLLPMVLIALTGQAKPAIFITIVVLFTCLGAIALPPWLSLMSDLVDEDKRGSYFGWRNKTLGFIVVAATLISGFILHLMKKNNAFYGFVIIFGLAFIFRIISWYFLTKMHEPELEFKKEHYFNLVDFLSRIRESNFARFTIFVAMMNFCVNLVSPFFAVLMLRDLRFGYLLYSLITVASTMTIYLVMIRWGRHADKVGNIKVIRFVSPLIGVVPLLWIFNQHPVYLFLIQIFAGFLWAGFNLCTTNFIYDAVTPPKRTRCISYFNVLNGAALCMGALLGGFLLQWLPPLLGYRILTLALISAVLRIIVGIFMPLRLKEVRPVKEVKSNELFFSMIGIRPLWEVDGKTIRY